MDLRVILSEGNRSASSMATSGSSAQISTHDAPVTRVNWKRLTDSVFEVYKPATGCISMEVVFVHGFQTEDNNDAFCRTWMKGDDSQCWLDTWLVECFPQARILSLSYDSSLTISASTGRQDMYLLGESLAQCLIELASVGQSCPVVLVGHCVGGLVLKEISIWAWNFATRKSNSGKSSHPYLTFLKYVKGVFFYSTPNLGLHVRVRSKSDQGGPLLEHLGLLSDKSARINSKFATLRRRHGWRTFGIVEANQTKMAKLVPYLDDMSRSHLETKASAEYLQFVSEASARADMDEFCMVTGVDHFTICNPDSRTSTSFVLLSNFLKSICKDEIAQVAYEAQLQLTLQLPLREIELDDRVDQVIAMLEMTKSKPIRLALVGMDGIGKSTLAKQVLLAIRHQFHYTCFVALENATDSLKSRELERLVAENLYHQNAQKVERNNAEPPWFLLRGKNTLLIVDDVVSEDQISPLLRSNWCGEGSRLIITSSRQIWMPDFTPYEVPLMSTTASHKLLEAQLEPSVLKLIPKALVSQVVDVCDGLPLTSVVIGRYLRDQKDVTVWSGALNTLQTADSLERDVIGNKLWKKLRLSVDTLTDLEKELFLDVATFDSYGPNNRRYDLNILRSAWRERYDEDLITTGLNNLVRRSLLRFDHGFGGPILALSRTAVTVETVYLHKVLQDLGKWISRPSKTKPSCCRSLWQLKDLTDVLTSCKEEIPGTQVLSLAVEHKKDSAGSRCQDTSLRIRWSSIGSLEVLRLLRISDMHMVGSDDDLTIPVNLALLHMENCTREPQRKRKWAPPWLPDSHPWPIQEENVERLCALSVLILESCSPVHLPDNFHTLRTLEILQIHSGGMSMKALPEKFGLLPSLKHLSLNVSLKKLPHSLLQLSSLRSLVLSGPYLEALPNPTKVYHYSLLIALTKLDLVDLPALSKLPESFGEMKSLKYLNLVACSALKKLPEGFGTLQQLETMTIDGCVELERLCESFSNLSRLRELYLKSLSALKVLPKTFGNLPSLEVLDLLACDKMRELPESFVDLQSLSVLNIFTCCSLESLWPNPGSLGIGCGLTKLNLVCVHGCPKLRGLPEFSDQLGSLQTLTVVGCEKLETVPDSLGKLTSLRTLTIHYERSRLVNDGRCLKGLPGTLGQIAGLRELHIDNCECLPASVGELSRLETLRIGGCKTFVGCPDSIARLTALKTFDIKSCQNCKEFLKSLGHLSSLTKLEIEDCQDLVSLPESISQLLLLSELIIVSCRNFVGLHESVGDLLSLRKLQISDCEKFVRLPDTIGQIPSLVGLTIENCENLLNLPNSICRLTSLENLCVFDCKSFEGIMGQLGQFTRLCYLSLSSWNDLGPLLESLECLKALRYLVIKCMICVESNLRKQDPPEELLRPFESHGFLCSMEEMEVEEKVVHPFDGCGCLHAKSFLKSLEQSMEEKSLVRSLRGEVKLSDYLLSRYRRTNFIETLNPERIVSFVHGRTREGIGWFWRMKFCTYEV